jgi:hypothetical protein
MDLRKSDIVYWNGKYYRVFGSRSTYIAITQNGKDFEFVRESELVKINKSLNLLVSFIPQNFDFDGELVGFAEKPALAYINKQIFYARQHSFISIQVTEIKTWVEGAYFYCEMEFTSLLKNDGKKVLPNYIYKTKN